MQWRNFKFCPPPRKETNWALLFLVPTAIAKGACKLLCKKNSYQNFGPLGPSPPHCGFCGVTIYATVPMPSDGFRLGGVTCGEGHSPQFCLCLPGFVEAI